MNLTAISLIALVTIVIAMAIATLMTMSTPNWRLRLIHRLGGTMPHPPLECAMTFWLSLPNAISSAALQACQKVAKDPSFASYPGSNLGREIRRDEAAEWAKLILRESKTPYRDSDVHLATELYFYLFMRK